MVANETPTKSGKWTRRLMLGVLVAVVGVGGSELLLRGIGLGKPILVEPDRAAGYILKPNQELHRFGGEVHVNSYGMRSDDLARSKAPGVFRLLVVGDSFAYGTTLVNQSHIFAGLLQKELPSLIHRPVEVLNASAGGWAISNELGYVRSRGLFDADLVLLVLNNGDATQPFAPYDPDGPPSVDHHPSFALQEVWERYLEPRIFPNKPAPVTTSTASEDARVAAENLGDLDQLLQLTSAAKIPLAIAYIPTPAETASPVDLIAWCTKHQVALINLSSAAAQWKGDNVLNPDGGHYNTKGNRLIADQLEKNWATVMPPSSGPAMSARQ